MERISIHANVGDALRKQKKIDQHNLPFTLNAMMGCLFGCRYCYTQGFPFKRHAEFGREVKVKLWLPEKLDRELNKYRKLPQHLKRVQVNPSTEGYLPQVIVKIQKEHGRDLMREILQIFKAHKDNENFWMVHLVTKSHMILNHLELLSSMRDQIQVELTITTLDEGTRKIIEGKAPSVKRRIEVIRALSDAGVFVRVMCMPFIGNQDAALQLRDVTFGCGAKAFKHKSMNYWDEGALLNGNLVRVKGRKDYAYGNLLVKSGEPYLSEGRLKMVSALMPQKKQSFNNLAPKSMIVENHGYAEINSVNWTYLM
jgi:DNA repair photolyase